MARRVSWKQRPLRPPKTPKLENKDPPYFSELRNYDQPVANATESWALATIILRLLLASWTDIIRGIFFILNWKILCFVSSKELTPCLFFFSGFNCQLCRGRMAETSGLFSLFAWLLEGFVLTACKKKMLCQVSTLRVLSIWRNSISTTRYFKLRRVWNNFY